jgi:hypothetical protein
MHGITAIATRSTSITRAIGTSAPAILCSSNTSTSPCQHIDNLTSAIAGMVPPQNMTTDVIDQLMHIFKQQAKTAKSNAIVQRVLKRRAQAEKVLTKAEPSPTPPSHPEMRPPPIQPPPSQISKSNFLTATWGDHGKLW